MSGKQSVVVVVAIVAYVIFYFARQVSWQVFKPRTVYSMPLLMLGGGAFLLYKQNPTLPRIGPLDIGVLALELLAAVAVGCVLGSLTQFSRTSGVLRYRLRPVGLVLWIGFLALRTVITYGLAGLGAHWIAAASASFLLVLGAIKVGQLPFIVVRSMSSARHVGHSRY
ncbi:hypothetical protein AB0J86_11900 [Micromonospora sp. NPDC049559]|uniref:hypothetical protein n=1 Tax=Micromonospora sp. NPDC049559 TaxID=3155923 RepID=UPI003439E75C